MYFVPHLKINNISKCNLLNYFILLNSHIIYINYISKDDPFLLIIWNENIASLAFITNICKSSYNYDLRFNSEFYRPHPTIYHLLDAPTERISNRNFD